MPRPLPPLQIASPCDAAWADMAGDDRVRHCALCDKNVYNVSALTAAEVLDLIQAEGRMPCLRLWQRADGTVLTADCPVGLRRVGSRRQRVAAAVVATALAALAQACTAPAEPERHVVMGRIACPTPPPKPPVKRAPARALQGAPAPILGEVAAPTHP